jgi:hypothetical protein
MRIGGKMHQTVRQFVDRWLDRNVDSAGITTGQHEMVPMLSADLQRAAAEAGFRFDEVVRYMGDVPTMIQQRMDDLYDEQA